MDIAESRVIVNESLLKDVMTKWFAFQHALDSLSSEECISEHQKLTQALREFEFGINKAKQISARNTSQAQLYLEAAEAKEAAIIQLKEEVEQMRKQYLNAKIERKNQEEYEMLAKLIQKHPSTADTERQVEVLKGEIATLQQTVDEAAGRVQVRNKQFQRLLHSVADLQADLAADRTNSEQMEVGEVEQMDLDDDEIGAEEEEEEGAVLL